MTKDQQTDIKVGLTVLVGILVLLLGIAWAKGWHFGKPEYVLRANFPSAGGLEVGDPVTINGIKRGAVSGVELRDSDVLVEMTFGNRLDMRQDARASITMLELMGGKKVEVLTGSSPVRLAKNAIIPGSYSGDIGSLVAMATSLSGTLASITGKADTLIGTLNTFFAGNDLKSDVNLTLSDARKTLAIIDGTAGRLNTLLAENGPLLHQTLAQTDGLTKDLSQTLAENRPGLRMFMDSTSRAVAEARATLGRASLLFGRFDSLFASNTERSLMTRLLKDEGFASRLDSALISLTKLSEQLRYQGLDANVRFFHSATPKE